MNIKKIIYLVLGFIGLILGAIGAVVPLLPAFPFLLLAAFSFAKSSVRIHEWFINTQLYKKNLRSFIEKKGMPWDVKRRVMGMITLVMGFGFLMMSDVPIGRIILFFVWIFHLLYFTFIVKTPEQMQQVHRNNE